MTAGGSEWFPPEGNHRHRRKTNHMPIDSLRSQKLLLSVLGLLALAAFLGLPAPAGDHPAERGSIPEAPRSVILLVGDGMGPQELGFFFDVVDARGGEPPALALMIEFGSRSIVRTASADSVVTDSAASATAFATGVDTANFRVGVDPEGKELRTCLEDARDTGRMTALVTTTRITHATPACFAAHVPSRDDENTIARQLLGARVDVLLGGGAIHFLGGLGGQELPDEIAAGGYRLVRTAEELSAAPRDGRLLGLFAGDNFPYRIDRNGGEGEPTTVPTLATMTRAALDRLDHDRGFFLMVEGGKIDHAGHMNDAAALLGEMFEFDEAVSVAREFAHSHPEVALIVTADHETGGLCLTYRGSEHPTRESLIALTEVEHSAIVGAPAEVTEERARRVLGDARLGFVPAETWPINVPALERSVQSFVSFASQGHSATPVLLLHEGAGERFGGLIRHRDLGQALRRWMSAPVPEND